MNRLWIACWLIIAAAAGLPLCAGEMPDFERQIAPLLVNHCLGCHQPSKRSGGLSVATQGALIAGGESGAALVPGDAETTLLLGRIADGEMPPPDAKEARPLSAEQIETLRAWIAAGAIWPAGRELGIHEQTVDLAEAKQFWSFQPVRRPAVPLAHAPASGEFNPIDAFIDERLAAAGVHRSPAADRGVLLRRISLDLRGMPPTLAEQDAFLADKSPDADERMIDRLLADTAHGERWARHWLDLVRYADSNGYERDQAKPSVWKYRDYVINAMNRDKPYDRFVIEQLAGDELEEVTDETLIATGFHALGAWQDEVDPLEAAQYRADELDDMVRTTSQTFLGVTLGCARCHNHKFDPLTMVDYYSLAAILASLKRPNKGRVDRDVPLGTPEQIAALHARNEELATIDKQILKLNVTERPPDAKERAAELRKRERELRAKTPDLPGAYRCYEDSTDAAPTFLLLSGRASNPGPLMQPRVPAVLTRNQPDFQISPSPPLPVSPSSTRRRLTLARWIASENNPLTARVIVNRVWQHHFGTGLVATPSDFGHMGARPTHPELLDWLAHWFMHDADWSLKKLHRLILASDTYRQTSHHSELIIHHSALYSRFPYRRLDVEAIRDSMLAAAGNINRQMHGPAVFLPVPDVVVEAHTDKQAAWKISQEPAIDRRTVYAFIKRTLLVPMLETLDFCDTTNSTELRTTTNVAPQALTLFNGDFVNRQAEQFAQRLEREAGDERAKQIELAYRLSLARPPGADESIALLEFLNLEAESTDQHHALVQACRVILNLNEFVYPN